jgi:anthranilate phosphoribosyltransferase
MEMPAAIRAVTERRDLSSDEMRQVMRTIMSGGATPAQIGGFLIGLRMKGESVGEIASAAAVMRELATPVDVHGPHLVDTCGTGGDGSETFNISTAVTFVVAAAGGQVAKHGNRSVSSRSGSADLLEAAGVRLDLTPLQVAHCIEEVGVGFIFAPQHHSAMKHAIGPRREMGVRTIFNLLGPLTNPAAAPNQVLGVYAREWVEPMARVLATLGSRHVMVVHSEDGMDEISIAAATHVAELKDGEIHQSILTPEMFGISRQPLDALRVASAAESLVIVRGVLGGEAGPASDIVALNAGAAIYVSGLVATLAEGVARAKAILAAGDGLRRLEQLVALSQRLAGGTA